MIRRPPRSTRTYTLFPISPAERAIADEELRNAEIIAERNERAALSKTTIKFTLAEDAELRSTMAGEKIVHLIGNTPDGRDARAVYKAPSYITDSSVFSVTAKLNAGRTVELVGYWRKRNWKDRNGKAQSVWEFQTMTLLDHA